MKGQEAEGQNGIWSLTKSFWDTGEERLMEENLWNGEVGRFGSASCGTALFPERDASDIQIHECKLFPSQKVKTMSQHFKGNQ